MAPLQKNAVNNVFFFMMITFLSAAVKAEWIDLEKVTSQIKNEFKTAWLVQKSGQRVVEIGFFLLIDFCQGRYAINGATPSSCHICEFKHTVWRKSQKEKTHTECDLV